MTHPGSLEGVSGDRPKAERGAAPAGLGLVTLPPGDASAAPADTTIRSASASVAEASRPSRKQVADSAPRLAGTASPIWATRVALKDRRWSKKKPRWSAEGRSALRHWARDASIRCLSRAALGTLRGAAFRTQRRSALYPLVREGRRRKAPPGAPQGHPTNRRRSVGSFTL